MEKLIAKTNQVTRAPKREFNSSKYSFHRIQSSDDPNFVEEELQIFSKKPRNNRRNAQKGANQSNGVASLNEASKSEASCSYADGDGELVKPKLNYRQLAFLAIKNAKFIPMQIQQIWEFIEKVFPYYAAGDERSQLLWKNALASGVRTGKCDEGHFTTNSVSGSGLKMFYGVRMDRIGCLDEQINRWRGKFNKSNISKSGLTSLDELNAICDGTKGVEFVISDMAEHVEQLKKSQLAGSNLEGYQAQERQRLQQARTTNPHIEKMLQEEEEKEMLKKAKKNLAVTCPVCEIKMNPKSLGRHVKLIHRFSDEDMARHRAELQQTRMLRREKKLECPSCGREFETSVMQIAHIRLCGGGVHSLPIPDEDTLLNEDSDEGGFDISQFMNVEEPEGEQYKNLVLL